jgi:hypothetical protein
MIQMRKNLNNADVSVDYKGLIYTRDKMAIRGKAQSELMKLFVATQRFIRCLFIDHYVNAD